ncbi:MAG: carbohydrate-binding domain-containing protein [Patescibacteria group bacterium]|nr:carbohydrate-binding domain-containing protein [Patescibacteria group bacterium]
MMRLDKAGETIVEVLLVVVILGSALTAAFAATGKATDSNQAAQERSEAAAYGQEQIERLKNLLAINDPALTSTFCIDSSNHVVTVNTTATPNGACNAGVNNRYSGYFSFDTATQTYTEKVEWDSVSAAGHDSINLVYRTEYLSDADGGVVAGGGGGPGGGGSGSPAPTDPCPTSTIPTGALQACYYNDINLSRFILKRVENPVGSSVANANATSVLDDNFGLGSPDPTVDTDDFSASYQGIFNFTPGAYQFTAGGDDGIRLSIDGVVVIDQFHQQGFTSYSEDYGITSGTTHTVKLEYYENRGAAAVKLSWFRKGELARTGLVWTNKGGSSPAEATTHTGKSNCWDVNETAEPTASSWNNNYLCSNIDQKIVWHEAGPLAGYYCAQALVADPDTWNDNYLCSKTDLGLTFSASPIAGQNCIVIDEPADFNGPWQTGVQLCEATTAPGQIVEGETFTPPGGAVPTADGAASAGQTLEYYSSGAATKTATLPAFQSIVVRARGDQYLGAPKMTITIDGTTVASGVDVANTAYLPLTIQVGSFAAGNHTITASFDNDAWCGPSCASQDRNLYIDNITFSPNKVY